jgi:hypothetical protein
LSLITLETSLSHEDVDRIVLLRIHLLTRRDQPASLGSFSILHSLRPIQYSASFLRSSCFWETSRSVPKRTASDRNSFPRRKEVSCLTEIRIETQDPVFLPDGSDEEDHKTLEGGNRAIHDSPCSRSVSDPACSCGNKFILRSNDVPANPTFRRLRALPISILPSYLPLQESPSFLFRPTDTITMGLLDKLQSSKSGNFPHPALVCELRAVEVGSKRPERLEKPFPGNLCADLCPSSPTELELYRLEQKYARRKNRSNYTTGAQYVDGEYIYNSGSQSASSSPAVSANSTGGSNSSSTKRRTMRWTPPEPRR